MSPENENPYLNDSPDESTRAVGDNLYAKLEPGHPRQIGQYSLRRVIDSGGMGVVYEAIQENPRRPVAIKVVKRIIADDSAVHRLEYEAQILARLRHPGIAQIYEAGSYLMESERLPFFAMEYIPNARSLTSYAREKNLSVSQRLNLMLQVCDAVHHGHQRGIVHRDLKPGNVLVDSHGRARIIDFGIAHAADAQSANPDAESESGRIIGTIAYMSPEQFEFDPSDIDTRADIYALGVVLYELLTGSLPYEVTGRPLSEAARIVREVPPKSMGEFTTTVADELEVIVRKALQKDRDQRYQSAYGFAQDIRRFLAGEAIIAKPPSVLYQIRVFARRNKLFMGSVAAAFLLLVAGIAVTTTLWLRVDAERLRAETESTRAETARKFLAEVISSTAPVGYFDQVTIADVLDRASPRVADVLSDDPLVEAEVRLSLGLGYFRLARVSQAEEHLLRSLELFQRELGVDHDRTLEVLRHLEIMYNVAGEYRKRHDIVSQIAQVCESRFGPTDPSTLEARLYLASAHAAVNKLNEAIDLTCRTMETCRQTLGSDDRMTRSAALDYAWLLVKQERPAEAEQLAREELERARWLFGEQDNITKGARSVLAAALISQGRLNECYDIYNRKPLPDSLDIEFDYQGGMPDVDTGLHMLVFFETWCPFSDRAMSFYETVYRYYGGLGLDILGLTSCSRSSTDEKVTGFISEKGLSFPIVRESGRAFDYYDCAGVPAIRLLHNGLLIWESTDNTSNYVPRPMLERMVATKPPSGDARVSN